MAYFAPYIDAQGLHIPLYEDVLAEVVERYKTIFGQEIYLDNDSMDYQQISILSRKIYDTYLSLQVAYSARSPISASGVALDTLAPMFSVYRSDATKSTVALTLNGVAGTIINNGIVSDENDNRWLLPDSVTIPESGIISVDCESQEYGRVYCLANTITKIITPVFGWRSVTNNAPSSPGIDVESDAHYRDKMINSSFSPSVTILEGIQSRLGQLAGVTRVRVYENDTGNVDSNGQIAHSICAVVENGDDQEIAEVLFLGKAPGVATYGDVTVNYELVSGNTNAVHFYHPTYTNVYVRITIKSLQGYSPEYITRIQNSVMEYINGVKIGESIYNSIIWGVALSALSSLMSPVFSITSLTMSTNGTTFNTNDIIVPFNSVASTSQANIQITVT